MQHNILYAWEVRYRTDGYGQPRGGSVATAFSAVARATLSQPYPMYLPHSRCIRLHVRFSGRCNGRETARTRAVGRNPVQNTLRGHGHRLLTQLRYMSAPFGSQTVRQCGVPRRNVAANQRWHYGLRSDVTRLFDIFEISSFPSRLTVQARLMRVRNRYVGANRYALLAPDCARCNHLCPACNINV